MGLLKVRNECLKQMNGWMKGREGTEKRNVARKKERERDASQQHTHTHTAGISLIFRADGRREEGKLL